MKQPSELTRVELVDLVTQIRSILFGRERACGDGVVEYFDRDKQFDLDTLNQIMVELDNSELSPRLGSESIDWLSETLFACHQCSTAWEPAALRGSGHCPACYGPCEPTAASPRALNAG